MYALYTGLSPEELVGEALEDAVAEIKRIVLRRLRELEGEEGGT